MKLTDCIINANLASPSVVDVDKLCKVIPKTKNTFIYSNGIYYVLTNKTTKTKIQITKEDSDTIVDRLKLVKVPMGYGVFLYMNHTRD